MSNKEPDWRNQKANIMQNFMFVELPNIRTLTELVGVQPICIQGNIQLQYKKNRVKIYKNKVR